MHRDYAKCYIITLKEISKNCLFIVRFPKKNEKSHNVQLFLWSTADKVKSTAFD